jgi:hypothetical protein
MGKRLVYAGLDPSLSLSLYIYIYIYSKWENGSEGEAASLQESKASFGFFSHTIGVWIFLPYQGLGPSLSLSLSRIFLPYQGLGPSLSLSLSLYIYIYIYNSYSKWENGSEEEAASLQGLIWIFLPYN